MSVTLRVELAKGGDELGGQRDGGAVLKQQRKALAELDDHARAEHGGELDLGEADVGARQRPRRTGIGWGHPAESGSSTGIR
jgi:hypothetical protein